jgi:hypothetical protein
VQESLPNITTQRIHQLFRAESGNLVEKYVKINLAIAKIPSQKRGCAFVVKRKEGKVFFALLMLEGVNICKI